MQALLAGGLAATAPLWPAIRTAYGWLHRAAHLLKNADGWDVLEVRRTYRGLLGEMGRHQAAVGPPAPAIAHFRKVTRSYWPGLFACYPDLPRTNNELERYFGAARYQERRASGRKVAAPAPVVRGSVRLAAAVATRDGRFTPEQLRPARLAAWRRLRGELDQRQEARRAQTRFRRDPAAYLAQAEALLQQGLPP
jgi:hypothetical protein